jgi:hypothetical protein
MARLTIFAKGNSDVADSLFFCSDAGTSWGGINEALRARGGDVRVRLRHETFIRSDALVVAQGDVPPALAHLAFDWPYTAADQFGTRFFDDAADAHVLSIQPDVTMKLLRHRASGALFYPGAPQKIVKDQMPWLRAECDMMPLLGADEALKSWKAVVARIRIRSAAPILFYNLSTVAPGDVLANYRGLAPTLTTRIKQFNLALIDLSAETGVFIVDVDRLSARYGADALKLDAVRLNAKGSRLVAEEVLRILFEARCIL